MPNRFWSIDSSPGTRFQTERSIFPTKITPDASPCDGISRWQMELIYLIVAKRCVFERGGESNAERTKLSLERVQFYKRSNSERAVRQSVKRKIRNKNGRWEIEISKYQY